MPNTVIIGAGPMGLFLAHRLHAMGVRDLVIYDPRAGEYTRPGHLHNDILLTVGIKTSTYITVKRKPGNTSYHIKDLERELYKMVSGLNVPIHKKKFVRFNTDAKKKEIVVADVNDNEETIECDYVFDCTGTNRQVALAVNTALAAPIFNLDSLCSEINVKTHLLAYVSMSSKHLDVININNTQNYEITNPKEYVSMIEKLRVFGWREFVVPRCYGVNFGSNKVCLYVECPDNLKPEQYKTWLKAAVSARVNDITDIPFAELADSKKYQKKPRLVTFDLVPKELRPYSYTCDRLPRVIPIGDAQIDPHYYLADGILNGIDRVERLLPNLTFSEGKIVQFNSQKYHDQVQPFLQGHKERVSTHFQERSQVFTEALKTAKLRYQKFLANSDPNVSNSKLTMTVKELDARIALNDAKAALGDLEATNEQEANKATLDTQLGKICILLTSALQNTAPHLVNLRKAILQSLEFMLQFCNHSELKEKYQTKIEAVKKEQPLQLLSMFSNLKENTANTNLTTPVFE